MCRTDNYILRITNTTLANGLTISSDYSAVSFDTPDYLRKKGKCKITVVDGNIHLREGDNDRIYNADKTIFVLTSNIPMLGYYTETRGQNNVLGTALVPYVGSSAVDKLINAKFDDNNPTIFTCNELPPVIEVKRQVYVGDELQASPSDKVLPFHVVLDIQFYEDMN